jgi:hypothetical protein
MSAAGVVGLRAGGYERYREVGDELDLRARNLNRVCVVREENRRRRQIKVGSWLLMLKAPLKLRQLSRSSKLGSSGRASNLQHHGRRLANDNKTSTLQRHDAVRKV